MLAQRLIQSILEVHSEFKIGDRVQWSYLSRTGDTGTVVSVLPRKRIGAGGLSAMVKVRWDKNNYVGSVEDRKLRKIRE